METVKNLFFQDHHTNQKWKLLKISYFKTTTSTQIWKLLKITSFKKPKEEIVKNLFQDHHIHPNMETVKNHHTNQK